MATESKAATGGGMAKRTKYYNARKQRFILAGIAWKPGEAKEVPKEVTQSKQFNRALETGSLVKV